MIVIACASCVQHSQDHVINEALDINLNATLEYLNELAEENGKNPDLYYQRAKVYLESQSYESAYDDINRAIGLRTDAMDYFLLKGKIEKQLNKPQQAIESLLTAEKLGARDQKLYEILASEYLILNEVEKAKAAVDRLIDLQQGAYSYALQADVMLAIGDSATAIGSYKKAIALNKTIRAPYIHLADIYRYRKESAKAGDYINAYLNQQPGDKEVLLKKGRLLADIEAYDSAKQVYHQVLRIDTTNYMVYYELSNVYYATRSYDSSAYMADKAALLNNEFLEAQLVVARSLDNQRKYQEAIATYEDILMQDSTFNLAATELDNLKRKVAYLWQMEQQRKAKDSARSNEPPLLQKKRIDN